MTLKPDAFLAACPSRHLLARIGEKWTLMVIVALAEEPHRFGALRARIEGVSQKMLTQGLRNLERDGLVGRQVFDEMPLRVEYRLTELGLSLLPLAVALKSWAEASLPTVEACNAHYNASRGGL
ncbi:MAG: helix-turn-helix domain-containing protein [Pseudomonadota bacterium]